MQTSISQLAKLQLNLSCSKQFAEATK